jgi:prepilin-type N-terminal cleavage/methylation domain-containing protein
VRRVTSRRRTTSPGARAGFTLVEVVFAIILLSVGLLSIASLGLATSRLTRGGSVQTVAATLAQARFDSIASLPCLPFRNAGTTTGSPPAFRGIREVWVVTAAQYRIDLVDTLRVPGRSRPLVYKSVLPCR